MKLRLVFLLSLILLFFSSAFPLSFSTKGQVIGWLTGNAKKSIKPMIGLRYIPTFSLIKTFEKDFTLDLEFSLNAYGTARFHAVDDIRTDGEIDPYRFWFRFATSQFEARIGLQKINFGSAMMLRPLMWFDRIDPRDPLQLTDGVYGLLIRYYFLNNANIWFWGLLGNEEAKGWEVLTSAKDIPEFGGRIQIPLGNGEAAVTYHHREIETKGLVQPIALDSSRIPENRFALDGKWDIGVGIWFEAAMVHQNTQALPYPWQRAFNVGLDYTLGWGNGLNVMGEHFVMTASQEAWDSGETVEFSALALNYPLGLLDILTGIFYFDWNNDDLYSFFRWQRTYDRWSIHVMTFWNPERFEIYQVHGDNNLFAGRGFQIMIVYNY
ncbi:MAG: hypothetical protein ACETWK_13260 [Candidatus Aminicenantaceae bacterium]